MSTITAAATPAAATPAAITPAIADNQRATARPLLTAAAVAAATFACASATAPEQFAPPVPLDRQVFQQAAYGTASSIYDDGLSCRREFWCVSVCWLTYVSCALTPDFQHFLLILEELCKRLASSLVGLPKKLLASPPALKQSATTLVKQALLLFYEVVRALAGTRVPIDHLAHMATAALSLVAARFTYGMAYGAIVPDITGMFLWSALLVEGNMCLNSNDARDCPWTSTSECIHCRTDFCARISKCADDQSVRMTLFAIPINGSRYRISVDSIQTRCEPCGTYPALFVRTKFALSVADRAKEMSRPAQDAGGGDRRGTTAGTGAATAVSAERTCTPAQAVTGGECGDDDDEHDAGAPVVVGVKRSRAPSPQDAPANGAGRATKKAKTAATTDK